jgi:hypothetical protein
MPGWAAKALEEVLTVTYWLDPGEHGGPFIAIVLIACAALLARG